MLSLSANIESDGNVSCALSSSKPFPDTFVLCLSTLAPVETVQGATIGSQTGGYTELLFKLEAEQFQVDFVLNFINGHRASNRAWLPLSADIRLPGGETERVALGWPLGVHLEPRDGPEQPQALGLIPPPESWAPDGGRLMLAKIENVVGAFDREAMAVSSLGERLGLGELIGEGGLVVEASEDARLGSEAYEIRITDQKVTVSAGSGAGAFYAFISLLWLRTVHEKVLPCGVIKDAPRFGWRGQHLDCARHYFLPETIHRLVDLMALLKLNRFHWHFADDEAFRLELDEFPGMAEATSTRGDGKLIPGVFGGGARPTGGTYDSDCVQKLIEHAHALHIEILPEIEFPAHALCLTRHMPSLRDPLDTGKEVSVQGYQENTMNPALSETWEFAESLVESVCRKFRFQHLHVGGDELPPGCWEGSPAVKALKSREGLDGSADVQGWTMAKLAGHLSELGVVPCAWEEATLGANGGIGHDAIIFSWTGQGPGLDAARRGHRVVMCPAQHTYFDMAHTANQTDWGATWAAAVSLEDTLDWDPIPESEPELEANVLGTQGTFWGEFTTSDAQLEPMIFPRILGLATKAWSPRAASSPKMAHDLFVNASRVKVAIQWESAPAEIALRSVL